MRNLVTIVLLLASTAAPSPASAKGGGLKGAKRSATIEQHRVLKEDDADGIDVDEILGFGCFSEDATVQVEHQDAPIKMKDLRIGDRVLTTDNNEYAPVYTFGHRLPAQKDVFVQLETPDANLQMTTEHLVFLRGKSDPVRADSIQPGDVLQTPNQEEEGAKVIATSILTRDGLYAPFTTKGTIVVDGISASSYISLQDHASEMVELSGIRFMSQHKFVHLSLSPLRMACLGISSKFCETDNITGMPSYISWSLSFQRFAESQHMYVQMIILTMWMVLLSLFMAVESIFGAAAAPSAVAFIALSIWMFRAMNLRVRCKMVFPRN